MEFRLSTKPSAGPSRSSYSRYRGLVWLVFLIGVVVILASQARRMNWGWVDGAADRQPQGPAVDTRLGPTDDKELPDAFRSPAGKQPATAEKDQPAAADGQSSRKFFPGVKPTYLESVRDDTVFGSEEMDAWFNLLAVLDKTPQATLNKASLGRVTFAQLFSQSAEYRGRLVTLNGTILRAHRTAAAQNQYGIKHFYQTWLLPSDNKANPIVVYCLELPEGFPTGTGLSEDVRATGFFFKRWAYNAQDGMRRAPLVLAKTLQVRKPAAAKEESFSAAWIGVAVVIGGLMMTFLYLQMRRTPARQPEHPPTFDRLGDIDADPPA